MERSYPSNRAGEMPCIQDIDAATYGNKADDTGA